MIRRWMGYALALLGAAAFRAAYTGWLAGVVLGAVACLPLLGVLAALPAVLTQRLRLSPERERVERGSPVCWQVESRGALGLPLGRVRFTVESVNAHNGLTARRRGKGFLPGEGGGVSLPAPTDHCGLLTGRLCSAWALDGLGLFWLPLRREGPARLWVEPVPRTGEELPALPEEERAGTAPRPGGGPGEDYDPRPYRPGDSLNAIHWKLSAKRDELITREALESIAPVVLLTLDCFGPPERLDGDLELLAGVSAALRAAGRPHAVAWAEPFSGELKRFEIGGGEQWRRCLDALLSTKAPEQGRSVLDHGRLGTSFHLRGGGEA